MVKSDFISSDGGSAFVRNRKIEDDAFLVGIHNRGGSEYLFAMWRRCGRNFWFKDQFVVFVAGSDASHQRTRDRLDAALDRWDSGQANVVYSGVVGWLEDGRWK